MLRREAETNAEARGGAEARVAADDEALAAAEMTFAELTRALADLTAQRNQLAGAVRQHAERRRTGDWWHRELVGEFLR